MSYCRFAWDGSDVYVYESSDGITCCGCMLGSGCTTNAPEEMIAHLAQHRRAGHFVPADAILALWEDVPGAQRPREAEPAGLTRSTIMLSIAMLKADLEKLPVDPLEPVAE
jgi:uncharacterized protein YktB (UPF0637 family)